MNAIEKRAREIRDEHCPAGNYCRDDILFALIVALTPQWQPIESAPRDGTFFLAVVKGFAPAVAQWTTDFRPEGEFTFLEPGMFADESHWDEMVAQTDPWEPTHWQPLPAPPEDSA